MLILLFIQCICLITVLMYFRMSSCCSPINGLYWIAAMWINYLCLNRLFLLASLLFFLWKAQLMRGEFREMCATACKAPRLFVTQLLGWVGLIAKERNLLPIIFQGPPMRLDLNWLIFMVKMRRKSIHIFFWMGGIKVWKTVSGNCDLSI